MSGLHIQSSNHIFKESTSNTLSINLVTAMAGNPLQSNDDFSLPYSPFPNKDQIFELLEKVAAAEKAIAEVKVACQQQAGEHQTYSNDTKEIRSDPNVLRGHTANEAYNDFARAQGNLVEAGPLEIM